MNHEKDKKQLIFILLAVLVPFAIYKISSVTFLPLISDAIVKTFIGESIFTAAVVVAAILVKKISTLKNTGKGLIKGILFGWPMIVLIVFSFTVWLFMLLAGAQSITVSAVKVVMLLVSALLIGIVEELMIRGVLINGLTDYFGTITPSTIRKAVLISSLVFGALHMFNIFTGVTVLCAFIQSVNAVFTGIFFGAIYIRSGKKLWTCIILHAVWDLISFLNGDMLMGKSSADSVNKANFVALVPTLIFAIYALFLLRNKKVKPLVDNQ